MYVIEKVFTFKLFWRFYQKMIILHCLLFQLKLAENRASFWTVFTILFFIVIVLLVRMGAKHDF